MKGTKAEVAEAAQSLRSAGWLSETPPDFQDAILSGCRWQWFAPGEAISHGGDIIGGMFGLAQGSVSIIPTLGVADAPIIHIGIAPFWHGSNPLINGEPRVMTIGARSRCLVARVPQYALEAVLAADPGRWRFIARHLTYIANLSMLVASDMQIRDSRRRCVAVLLRIANCRNGSMATATAEMTQDELAAMANLSRQTTGPILRELADAGLATVGYRSIVLHDAAALRAMVAL